MAKTLEELRTTVRQQSNTENTRFVEDDEIDSWINTAAKRLWRKTLGADESLASEEFEFTLTSTDDGNREDLPSGFWKAQGLDFLVPGQQPLDVLPYNFGHRNRPGYRGFRIQGGIIRVDPWRNAAGDYVLIYLPDYEPLVDDADELPAILDRLDEYITTVVAIKVKDKREMPTDALTNEQLMLEAEIAPVAQKRQGLPVQAAVHKRYSGLPGGYGGGDDPARGG
jgi:hypothetical protein